MVLCDNGLDVVRIVHKVSRFVHIVAVRKFPRVPEKSSEIPEIPESPCRGLLASTVWARVPLHLHLQVNLVPASPEPFTCSPREARPAPHCLDLS
jgi:hypothetical protein